MGSSMCRSTDPVDHTDSFIDPEQFRIIRNVISTDINMFENYLRTRKTVGDVELYTRELKILVDNEMFVAATMYVSCRKHRIDYAVALANRPVSLRSIVPIAENFMAIMVNWAFISAIRTGNLDHFSVFRKMHKNAHLLIRHEALEDPQLTYKQVKKVLNKNSMWYIVNMLSKGKTHSMAEIGAYRAARYILTQRYDYATYACHLRRLHAIEPLDIPLEWYVKLAKTGCSETCKFLAELNQTRYDELVDVIDWNSDRPGLDTCTLYLSDAAFERAMGLVWDRELVEKYRGARAVHHRSDA